MTEAVRLSNTPIKALSKEDAFSSSTSDKIKKRIESLVFKGAIGAWAATLFVLTLGGTGYARLYSHFSHRSLPNDIEEAQIKSVSGALLLVLSGPNRGQKTNKPHAFDLPSLRSGLLLAYKKEKGIDASAETKRELVLLVQKVLKIRGNIERLAREESVNGGMNGIYTDLCDAMKIPFYQTIKHQDSEAINFLQFVAIKLLSTDGTDALKNYGKKCIGDLQSDAFSPIELTDHITRYLAKPGFSLESGSPIWIASHPHLAMYCSKSTYDPIGYDGARGNPNFSAHTFQAGKKQMTFYFGPGPTGSPIFEHGLLPAYKKFGVFELRFNHQDVSSGEDYKRIQEIQRMADRNPGVLQHALLGFDTKMRANKGISFKNPDTFFASYRNFVKKGVRGKSGQKNHSGFDIPEGLLSDSQIDTALSKAQEFCKKLSENNSHWKKAMEEKGPHGALRSLKYKKAALVGNQKAQFCLSNPGKARMAKMMQLVTDAYLTLAMVYRSFDAITPEMIERSLDAKLDKDLTRARTSGACKQDVDRGVVENIALRLFFRWSESPLPLTRDEMYEIVGAVLGRARLASDRNIMVRRYQILDDLLRFVGSAQGGVSAAHDLLKGYSASLRYTATAQKR